MKCRIYTISVGSFLVREDISLHGKYQNLNDQITKKLFTEALHYPTILHSNHSLSKDIEKTKHLKNIPETLGFRVILSRKVESDDVTIDASKSQSDCKGK